MAWGALRSTFSDLEDFSCLITLYSTEAMIVEWFSQIIKLDWFSMLINWTNKRRFLIYQDPLGSQEGITSYQIQRWAYNWCYLMHPLVNSCNGVFLPRPKGSMMTVGFLTWPHANKVCRKFNVGMDFSSGRKGKRLSGQEQKGNRFEMKSLVTLNSMHSTFMVSARLNPVLLTWNQINYLMYNVRYL